MALFKKRQPPAPGEQEIADLQQIDDLEARIVLARQQTWRVYNVPADEIAVLMPGVVAEAKVIADKLREEYHARKSQP